MFFGLHPKPGNLDSCGVEAAVPSKPTFRRWAVKELAATPSAPESRLPPGASSTRRSHNSALVLMVFDWQSGGR